MTDRTVELAVPSTPPLGRGWILVEVAIVLGLTLGKSAIYSILSIIDMLTQPKKLEEQTTSLTGTYAQERPWLDLSYQVAAIAFPLVGAALAMYLLHLAHGQARRRIGFDLRQPGKDLLVALGMAAGVGIPGIAFYVAALRVGINTRVEPSNLQAAWWTIPVYLGYALMNGILEEVVMVGYFLTRLRDAGHGIVGVVAASCLIRGTYHLYQGFGGGAGNLVMGILFCLVFLKTKRVMPLVIAHVVMDIVVFVGYPLAYPHLGFLH